MNMLYNTLGKRTNYKPALPWELAAHSSVSDTSVLFHRNPDGDEKNTARKLVLDLFHPDIWASPLHMVTMPGVHWKFERKLLGMREGDWMNKPNPRRTKFCTVENNRAIYSASMYKIPGLHVSAIKEIAPRPFAEIGFRTSYTSHFFCNADDFIAYDNWGFDAAWLDYTGPLSIERLNLIQRFYNRLKSGTLIVTALRARWNRATSDAISNAGGYSEWLRQHLVGNVLHDIQYFDTSPMAQFAVTNK